MISNLQAAVPELVEEFHIPDSETNSQYLPMVRTAIQKTTTAPN